MQGLQSILSTNRGGERERLGSNGRERWEPTNISRSAISEIGVIMGRGTGEDSKNREIRVATKPHADKEETTVPLEGTLTRIHGKVYDLAPFLDRHPGGADLLMLAAGRDATTLFQSYHRCVPRMMPSRLKQNGEEPEKDHHPGDWSRRFRCYCSVAVRDYIVVTVKGFTVLYHVLRENVFDLTGGWTWRRNGWRHCLR